MKVRFTHLACLLLLTACAGISGGGGGSGNAIDGVKVENAKPQDGGFVSGGLDWGVRDVYVLSLSEAKADCQTDLDPDVTGYRFSFKGTVLPPSLKGTIDLNGRVLRWVDESVAKYYDVALKGTISEQSGKLNNQSGGLSITVTSALPLQFKLLLLKEGESANPADTTWKDCTEEACSKEFRDVVMDYLKDYTWEGITSLPSCAAQSQAQGPGVNGILKQEVSGNQIPLVNTHKDAPELNLPKP